ncbi:3-ketosteroid-9-alpha-monooxygenase oxygenase subunit [Enhygromyxa salina]|uniref:cholesterol 7-desaturase n=1 Tax=Enhygromyxa salina TaxID=215803 RepID=A0A2S9YBV0_9BACT|nr:Rieske 2Fe-2S domain-containing protein [Enhygromyxa salina]PRQ02580.1 3-ketosteroid-9-alpha-monooxygenase oxygenase subunit [Enhygromyxa salina]
MARIKNVTKRYMRPPPQYVHDWFSPLRSSEVVPGKITTFNFMGHELIAFRDTAGKVHVLDAHCPHFGGHRGVGGRIEDDCVRCPFHGLHFNGEGQCVKGDFVKDQTSLRHVKSPPWTVHEVAASIFIWHGTDRTKPDRPLPIAAPGFFDGWSEPVTNAGRPLQPTNVFFPTENIIDIQHFYAVHCWELQGIERHPAEDEDGSFSAVMNMTWIAGAQSPSPLIRRLGKAYSSPFRFDVRVFGPGLALAISELTPEQGSLQIMNIIVITPVNQTDCHIRAITSVKHTIDNPVSKLARRVLKLGFEEILSRVFLAIATKDFDGDEMIWTKRTFLENPKPLPDDGPIVAYRKWCQRFWPPDYLPDGLPEQLADAPQAAAANG